MLVLLPLALAADPPPIAPDPRGAAAPDRAFDMEKLRLSLALQPDAGAVEGTATWTARRLGPGPMVLDQVALDIQAVTLGGAPVPFRVRGDTLEIDVPGERAEVVVRYRATPQTGLHFRHDDAADAYGEVWSQGEATDNRHWFPGWDHPNDRFVYEGDFTAPPGWKVLTNSGQDVVNYLVMVAAGPYEIVGEPTNQAWVPPGTSKGGVSRVTEPIPSMMAHFGARTGVAYPWGPYRQVFVQRFLYTGMENTSATVEARWMVGGDAVAGTRTRGIQSVVAHELAHQWYGDLLTCRSLREMWLNEGFATFFAADWQASIEGPEQGAAGVRGRYRASLGEAALAKRYFLGQDKPDSTNVYNKGASVLQMLRVMLGEDAFWAGIRAYTAGHARGLVDTADLADAMEAASGQELGWFFQQWVDLPYVPELTVSSRWADGGLTVTVAQATGAARPAYTLPVEVEVAGELHRAWLTGEDVELRVPMAAPPAYVAFDPRGGVLAKVEQEQDPSAWEAQLASAHPYARFVAIEALGETARTEPLAALAGDARAARDLRRAAIVALGAQRATAALLPLVGEPDEELRGAVFTALGQGVGKDAVPALTKATREANPDLAGQALTALARLDGPAAAKLARTAVRRTGLDDTRLVGAAAGVLGEHGDPADLALLLKVTGPDRNRVTSLGAAARLAGRQDPGQGRDALLRQVARAAEACLDDPDQRTREGAVAILGEVGDEATVSRLEAWRRTRTTDDARDAAAAAIAAIRGRGAPTETQNEMEARMEALEQRVEELMKQVEDKH